MPSIPKAVFAVFILAGIGWIYSSYKRAEFPPETSILEELAKEPLQETITEEPFVFEYRGTDYEVHPLARYELWGMIVTHNDISSFADIYHSEDSVDFRDICVIWGDNLYEDFYQEADFWSEPWTCYFNADSREVFDKFNGDQLSNSHLLTDNDALQKEILEAEIGDQIYISGMLVNYREDKRGSFFRKSSLVRTDTGNGACEVMFVEDFKNLKRNGPFWTSFYHLSSWLCILAGISNILLFLFLPYKYYHS